MKYCFFALLLMLAPLAPAQSRSDAYQGGLVTPPLPKPRFVLTDTSGAPFDFWTRTSGSVTLLFLGYTSCPDQCPMHMSNIGVALKKLPAAIADQVKLVFVTTDPTRDTPVGCAKWVFNSDVTLAGLTEAERRSVRARKPPGVPPPMKPEPGNVNDA